VHTFTGVKLRTRGLHNITVIDTAFPAITGRLAIEVS
jgi:hypothetical protein